MLVVSITTALLLPKLRRPPTAAIPAEHVAMD
jgi:hypothetical protein